MSTEIVGICSGPQDLGKQLRCLIQSLIQLHLRKLASSDVVIIPTSPQRAVGSLPSRACSLRLSWVPQICFLPLLSLCLGFFHLESLPPLCCFPQGSVPFEILLGLPFLTMVGNFNVTELSGQLLSVSRTVTPK